MEADSRECYCRFCLQMISEDEKQIFVNSYLKIQFLLITQLPCFKEPTKSTEKYCNICESCFNLTKQFGIFRSMLVKNQKIIEELSNNEKTSKTEEIENSEIVLGVSQADDRTEVQQQLTVPEIISYEEEYIDEEFLKTVEICDVSSPASRSKEKLKFCSKCDKNYKVNEFKRHFERVHLKLKKFHCDFCSYKTYSKGHIEIHVKSHLKIKNFFCEKCGKAFGSGNILRIHYLKHRTDRPYHCDECSLTFKSPYALKRHQKTHTIENRKIECCECGMKFLDNWHLKRHSKKHQKTIPSEKCEICGKIFQNLDSLRSHQIYHQEPQFLCDVENCNKKFHKRTDYESHKKVHRNQKDFKCSLCPNNAYFRIAHLNRHITKFHS